MGKGDKRSRKGKIWRGSYGKVRPKNKNIEKVDVDKEDDAEKKNEEQAELTVSQ